MPRRYVPKTYNNRRFLRLLTTIVITLALAFVISFFILFFTFQSYVVDGELQIPWLAEEPSPRADAQQEAPLETEEPELSPTAPPTPSATPTATPIEASQAGSEVYTIEQIQNALQAQFMANAFADRNPVVVSFEEVEMDRDFIILEGAGPDAGRIDLTNSSRYKVEIRFEQPTEEYNIWQEIYQDEETSPFRRDGNHTIMTDYYYINDVAGEPVLAFIKD